MTYTLSAVSPRGRSASSMTCSISCAALAAVDQPPLRRFRFTIAHEVGHWVCHCLEGRAPALEPSYCRPVDLTEATDRALEREANVFAAELLMPEPAVRKAWAELGDVAACARRFDVSPTAMQWRLYAFELIEEKPA